MSEPIKVGDLVMVVRGHSCVTSRVGGIPFRVRKINPQKNGGWTCSACWTADLAPGEMYGAELEPLHTPNTGKGIPLGWLKRIPPLEELDDVKRDEEITV